MGVGTLKRLTFAATTVSLAVSLAVTLVMTLAQPAAAFNMRQALQAVENLGQWSVMAQKCGDRRSAADIRKSIQTAVKSASISQSQRKRLLNELQYWVKTINHNFSTGGLAVETACPIWQDSGLRGVKKEFSRLHKQLG